MHWRGRKNDGELKVVVLGKEHHLLDVYRMHPHLMIARPLVGAMELIKEFLEHGNGELILRCLVI